jgi:hypothetical protein
VLDARGELIGARKSHAGALAWAPNGPSVDVVGNCVAVVAMVVSSLSE